MFGTKGLLDLDAILESSEPATGGKDVHQTVPIPGGLPGEPASKPKDSGPSIPSKTEPGTELHNLALSALKKSFQEGLEICSMIEGADKSQAIMKESYQEYLIQFAESESKEVPFSFDQFVEAVNSEVDEAAMTEATRLAKEIHKKATLEGKYDKQIKQLCHLLDEVDANSAKGRYIQKQIDKLSELNKGTTPGHPRLSDIRNHRADPYDSLGRGRTDDKGGGKAAKIRQRAEYKLLPKSKVADMDMTSFKKLVDGMCESVEGFQPSEGGEGATMKELYEKYLDDFMENAMDGSPLTFDQFVEAVSSCDETGSLEAYAEGKKYEKYRTEVDAYAKSKGEDVTGEKLTSKKSYKMIKANIKAMKNEKSWAKVMYKEYINYCNEYGVTPVSFKQFTHMTPEQLGKLIVDSNHEVEKERRMKKAVDSVSESTDPTISHLENFLSENVDFD